MSPREGGADRLRGDGERPREGGGEPLERLVLVLELVPLELEEPPLLDELPLLDEDGIALDSGRGRPANGGVEGKQCFGPTISGHGSVRGNRRTHEAQRRGLLASDVPDERQTAPFTRCRRWPTSSGALNCRWGAIAPWSGRDALQVR